MTCYGNTNSVLRVKKDPKTVIRINRWNNDLINVSMLKVQNCLKRMEIMLRISRTDTFAYFNLCNGISSYVTELGMAYHELSELATYTKVKYVLFLLLK